MAPISSTLPFSSCHHLSGFPTHTFFILFNLLSFLINNFWGLFGIFYFYLLTRFSWFCMPCLRPNSHFISSFKKTRPCLGQVRPSFYDSQDIFKTTLMYVSSSCTWLFILRAFVSRKRIWITWRRTHGPARRCNTAFMIRALQELTGVCAFLLLLPVLT